MKSTTSLKKISKLSKKIRCVKGGQGAGKTIAIMMILINHAARKKGRKIFVVSEELTKMRDTVIDDAKKIAEAFGIGVTMTGFDSGRPKMVFPNGSFIRFAGLDKEDVGKGLRCHVIYFNEANKINFETYRQSSSRADVIYIDYNPDNEFWVDTELYSRKDFEMLTLTFQDNEYLGESERSEILLYFEKGYGIPYDGRPMSEYPEPISKYWANKWRVYGLGLTGILEGAVHEEWEIIDEVPDNAKLIGGGIDFGYQVPAAWVHVYQLDGAYIIDEIIYEPKLSNQDLGEIAIDEGVHRVLTYADNAEPKSIEELQRMGCNVRPCDGKKDLINFAIKKMNQKTIYITKRSTGTISEIKGYKWDTDRNGKPTGKPVKKNDHAMNAIQYCIGTVYRYDGRYR